MYPVATFETPLKNIPQIGLKSGENSCKIPVNQQELAFFTGNFHCQKNLVHKSNVELLRETTVITAVTGISQAISLLSFLTNFIQFGKFTVKYQLLTR